MDAGPHHDLAALEAEHTPESVARRFDGDPAHSYLRDSVYGAIDGTVTTFAVVAGAVGAGLGGGIVLIFGFANLFADGLSMAVSNYLGTRADEQLAHRKRREEERHIELVPDGEREEVRQIFAAKGFDGAVLEQIVDVITADRDRWIETMLREEHGLALEGRSALRAAASTFVAFLLVGALPLLPFVADLARDGGVPHPFAASTIVMGVAFFVVGAVKGVVVERTWWLDGLETLGLGGASAGLAYLAGWLLRGLADAV